MRVWLREIREIAGKTQLEVANKIGISAQMFNFIENGRRRPSPELAKKIAEELGFEWTQFFEEDKTA